MFFAMNVAINIYTRRYRDYKNKSESYSKYVSASQETKPVCLNRHIKNIGKTLVYTRIEQEK